MNPRDNIIYTFGRFHLDAAERRLSRDGQVTPLTPKAFDTLLTLVQHSGHAVTKDELMRAVWPEGFVEEVNLAYNISILRKALADGQFGETYIETVPKLGYRFVAPVQTKSVAPMDTTDATFGDLLSQHLHRRHGLSQSKLAAGILQAPAVITAMCKGRRLTGPQARQRVLAIIGWLHTQGALETLVEANALLNAAGMAGLNGRNADEATLTATLKSSHVDTEQLLPMRSAHRHNLPAQLTRFIGRERELAEVADSMRAKRLVTVTGAAGMGKTRLALQVGESILHQFADGVWLVEFAPLADEALVATAVASTFGLSEQPVRPLVDVLTAFIGEKHMLVILDNCEHLIEGSARLVEALLRACPNLHILATSREALRLPGEVTWRIPPLSAPDSNHLPSIAHASDFDAVRLFVEHATLVEPDFAVASDDLATIVHVCHQLDGMPLAIEMAAALIPFLGLSGVSTGLDDRLALLTNNNRTAIPHHQTLRATLDWSYNLLTESERALLARLSVFAGGWTAQAAQAVCESTHYELLQLVRHSLVMMVVNEREREGQPRYRLLETIRHYAAERLREGGKREATLDRHLAYFLDMAEEPDALAEFAGPRVNPWVRRMDAELDNMRAAFAWAMKRADEGESALRLANAMLTYVFHRGHLAELRMWADQAWSRAEKASTSARAHGLLAKASSCLLAGDKIQGVHFCEEALALLRQTDDRAHLAGCLEMLANNAFDHRVQAYAEEALPLFRELGSKDGEGRIMRALGTVALREGNHVRAAQLLEQAIELAPWDATVCYMHLYEADPQNALRLCAQKHAQLMPSHDPDYAEYMMAMLMAYGTLLLAEGDYSHAKHVLEECIWANQQINTGQPFDPALLISPLPLNTSEMPFIDLKADLWDLAITFLLLGWAEHILGRDDYASARLDQGHALVRDAGSVWIEVIADFLKLSLKISAGHVNDAMQEVIACLHRFNQTDLQLGVVCALVQKAGLEVYCGDLKRACRLLGMVESYDPKVEVMFIYMLCLPSVWLRHAKTAIIVPTLAAARAVLGDAEFEAAYAEGAAMTLEQAVEYALNDRP